MRYDVVIIGGGLAGMTAGVALQRAGKRCCVVAAGLSLHQTPRAEYVSLGGTLLAGDSVVGGEFDDNVLKCVKTSKLGETPLCADAFILCTGKFFSRGLRSDMDHIYETVFGCDVQYDQDPSKWVAREFAADQPFMSFGVLTDPQGHVSIDGKPIENLYAAGEILAGKVDIEKSALEVCRNLI